MNKLCTLVVLVLAVSTVESAPVSPKEVILHTLGSLVGMSTRVYQIELYRPKEKRILELCDEFKAEYGYIFTVDLPEIEQAAMSEEQVAEKMVEMQNKLSKMETMVAEADELLKKSLASQD